MKEIHLTINGKKIKGKEGDTVLELCQANGIDMPTLCHLDGLTDVGACRLCVVEIEKERRPVPSCTYPARDGLVVETSTEKLEKYRRQILELIFTEHNHFCMFCEKSGDCELQKLAYRYQMDHVRYPYNAPSLSVDSLSEYLVIDHNRCILCGRCIRACSDVAANRTLDFSQRGWKTLVSADMGQPLGESSCLCAGACVQACPTGAIFSKFSLYKGRTDECEQISTICPACGVGCELKVLVKDNNLVKIEAPDLMGIKGNLCKMGRFDLLRQAQPRITSPMIRNKDGELEACTIDKALGAVAGKIKETDGSFVGMASSKLPNETLSLFSKLIGGISGSDSIDTLDGKSYRVISEGIKRFGDKRKGLDIECSIEQILQADCIIIVGGDPEKTNPVVGTLVRRAINQRGAKLVVIDSSEDVFPLRTNIWLKPNTGSEGILLDGLAKILADKGLVASGKANTELVEALSQYEADKVAEVTGVDKEDLRKVAEVYGSAERGVIIYGEDLLKNDDPNFVSSVLRLADIAGNRDGDKLCVISLKPNANSRGAWELGLARGIKSHKPKGLYLLLGDDSNNIGEELSGLIKETGTLIVQASYHSSVTAMADVVLPSPIWAERDGKYVCMDGNILESKRVLQPIEGMLQDKEVLIKLSRELGHKL
jgi:predicted molibdopterin-dependent oxidoreductase YjgC